MQTSDYTLWSTRHNFFGDRNSPWLLDMGTSWYFSWKLNYFGIPKWKQGLFNIPQSGHESVYLLEPSFHSRTPNNSTFMKNQSVRVSQRHNTDIQRVPGAAAWPRPAGPRSKSNTRYSSVDRKYRIFPKMIKRTKRRLKNMHQSPSSSWPLSAFPKKQMLRVSTPSKREVSRLFS